jgi:hypothetical protein
VNLLLAGLAASATLGHSEPAGAANHRLIVLADMGNEPDEEQQMTHLLIYANEIDLEGLVAVTGKYLKTGPRPDLFHKLIDGYVQVVDNLRLHADGWPTAQYLHGITVAGQPSYGIADVGKGKSSPGSKLILTAATKDDPRPLHIVVNAGSNTLAQALWDYRATHAPAEVEALVGRLRVYENGAQDNAGAWICHFFPTIHWVRSNYQTYAYMGPGRGGRGPHVWRPHAVSNQGQHDWAKEHIQTGHGPLGALYPDRRFRNGRLGFLEGGGTTPWMGLLNKGLYDPSQPAWGGWGGRFTARKVENVWSRHDDIKPDERQFAPFAVFQEASDAWTDPETGARYENDFAPVWRWRRAMLNDFQCRMDWCVKSRADANHNPLAAVDGDCSNAIIRIKAAPGDSVALDAAASRDPDGDPLDFDWFVYPEAGSYHGKIALDTRQNAKTELTIPADAAGKQMHVILQVRDRNSIAFLFDYRRVVVDVEKAK